jgi:hypothetical protein
MKLIQTPTYQKQQLRKNIMNEAVFMPEMSEKFDVVMKQLMLAKKEMGSSVKKDARNPFHKSNYATLGAHLDLCEETLDKHGMILLQTINGSPEKAVLVATLCHPESGQWIKSYLPLPNPKGDSQGLGASITYMRRYSINSMLGLSAEDDDGESACVRQKPEKVAEKPKPEKVAEKPKPVISEQQSSFLLGIVNQLDQETQKGFLDWLKKEFGAAGLKDVPSFAYERCTTVLNAKLKYIQNKVEAVA